MSGLPDELPLDAVLLFRRASPEARDRAGSGGLKAVAFKLRPSRGETALSLYASTLVAAEALLLGAPAPGWGVASITAGELRSLGFTVVSDSLGDDHLATAHVSATPASLTPEGQIPLEVSRAIARLARWVIEPGE